jgi:hypothetical protein
MRCNDLVEKELPILGVWWTHLLNYGFQYVLPVYSVLVHYLRFQYLLFEVLCPRRPSYAAVLQSQACFLLCLNLLILRPLLAHPEAPGVFLFLSIFLHLVLVVLFFTSLLVFLRKLFVLRGGMQFVHFILDFLRQVLHPSDGFCEALDPRFYVL